LPSPLKDLLGKYLKQEFCLHLLKTKLEVHLEAQQKAAGEIPSETDVDS
jgi:hypothetical protein